MIGSYWGKEHVRRLPIEDAGLPRYIHGLSSSKCMHTPSMDSNPAPNSMHPQYLIFNYTTTVSYSVSEDLQENLHKG
jgi:hypothetical protein